jgi:hypothetical protein
VPEREMRRWRQVTATSGEKESDMRKTRIRLGVLGIAFAVAGLQWE